jgi:hypothetical protein
MTKNELIQILNTFPGDPEVVVEWVCGEVSVPIQRVATYDNSSTPEVIHLVTKLE